MRNNRLLPYETIVQAASGEPEAVGTVLQYYRRRIQCAARFHSMTAANSAFRQSSSLFTSSSSNRPRFSSECSTSLEKQCTRSTQVNAFKTYG